MMSTGTIHLSYRIHPRVHLAGQVFKLSILKWHTIFLFTLTTFNSFFWNAAATSRPWKSLALHKDCVNPVWLVYQLVGASNVEYKLISEDGPDHAKCFKTLVKYKDKEFVAAGND